MYPDSEFVLEFDGLAGWLEMFCGSFDDCLTEARAMSGGCEWRIIRRADNLKIAQSKGA